MIDIKRIVCPVDFSPYSERALMHAAWLASWYRCRITALHVTTPLPHSEAAALATPNRTLIQHQLDAMVSRARALHSAIDCELCEADRPAAAIVERSNALDAGLLVMGSHGRSGFERLVLGSVTEAVVREAPCPVLVVPSHLDPAGTGSVTGRNILCAVDFSTESLAAVAHAMALAEEQNATLTLLNVIAVPPELRQASHGEEIDVDSARAEAEAGTLRRLRALVPDEVRRYCTVQTAVTEGGVARQILREAVERRAVMIVMGVHGRSKLDLLVFGSNTQDVLRRAHCPVLVVRSGRRRQAGGATAA